MRDKKIYNKIKREITILDLVLSFSLLCFFAFSGSSRYLQSNVEFYTTNEYLQFVLFFLVIASVFYIASLPLDYYSSYVVEHDFELSNQSLSGWFCEKLKHVFVGAIIAIPIALVFYLFLKTTGSLWWLYFGLFYILFTLIIVLVAPVLILPVFYKTAPLNNQELSEKLSKMAVSNGISVKEIKTFNLSKNTKKANAALTGLGSTKTILLADTLLESFSHEEIFAVFAHEIGHFRGRHIVKNLVINSVFTLLSLFCCAWAYFLIAGMLGYGSLTGLAALPLLAFLLFVFSFILTPLLNSISRAFEFEADAFAVRTAGKKNFVSALRKLAEKNLSDDDAPALYEYFFFSHPLLRKRIVAAEALVDVTR